MKTLKEKCSFIVRLGMTAAVLLFAQHALAAGTTAGTDVDNMATVDYIVGGVAQTEIESSPTGNSTPGSFGTLTTFVVDNRVDFTLVQVGAAHTTVGPGETDAFVEFLLTNTGNSAMDFRLVTTQLGSADGAVNGLVDTNVDMSLVRVRVGNGGGVPVLGDLAYVDEILEDASVTIYVFADAGVALVDNDIANLELEGTAAAAGLALTLGGDLSDDAGSADLPAVVDVVFANGVVAPGLGDGTESDRDGFDVQSAALVITKVATVIWDPFNEAVFPKAIPGAIVEYVITVDNTGAEDADNVVITDSIDTDVTFIFDAYTG
ncbi:MAG: hypothetical protein O7G83_12915, partial [Proteobacteria bacterium]|nr:hypothetical protein [Pseudomonadota bacterium]